MDKVMDTLFDRIIQYEDEGLSEEDHLSLFQELLNSGLAWQLQGSYGREAKALLEAGLITLPEED